VVGLARYGICELAISTLLAAGLVALAVMFCPPAAAVPLLMWFGVLWFFRDPNRRTTERPNVLLSPADGKVSDITPIGPDSELGQTGTRIGIFMRVYDVHVNRSPARAVVEVFLDARDPLAAERNESVTVCLRYNYKGRDYPLVVRQVAGMIARRIVSDVKVGQELSAGQRIGMIKFGSRLELLVPQELIGRVCVLLGQRVRAGCSVLVTAEEAEG